MGELTLSQMRTEVLTVLEDNDKLTSARLTQFINQAYRHVCRPPVFEHTGLQSTTTIVLVSGTSVYSLPTDLITIMHDDGVFVTRSDGQITRLHRKSHARLVEDVGSFTNNSGYPSRYSRRAQSITLTPTPGPDFAGATLTVNYRRRPPLLVADGDTTLVEAEFDTIIKYLAAAYGWADLGQPQRSDYYRDFALGMLNDYKSHLDLDATDPTEGFEIEEGNLSGGYVETY